jgi:MFS family permease
MTGSLTSPRRFATIALALGLAAAGMASPAFAIGRGGGPVYPQSGPMTGNFSHGAGRYEGRGGWNGGWNGGWGPAVGAGVVGGLIGGAIIGSAGYPYGYGSDPCWQYQNVYSNSGAYLGRQLVNTCQ